MSIFKEIPPTAGFPIRIRDFLSIFNIKNYRNFLEDDFKKYLNTSFAKITCSGTAGLYLILESLKDSSGKKTILIPSYICPSVPLAIKMAGLKTLVCDINQYDFNFNLLQLEELCRKNNDILAIVAAHIGGIPLDFDAVENIAKKQGIFTIEDCAQGLGAVYKGKKVGTIADFSFFSLARGKGLTIYEGGAVVTNKKEYKGIIDDKIRLLVKDDFMSEGIKILELFGYSIFYRPELFWFVYRFPEVYWSLQGNKFKAESEYFEADFPVHNVSSVRKTIGHLNFYRLEQEIAEQRQKALYYIEGLKDIVGVKIIKEPPGCRASYPFLTIIFNDIDKKKRALRIFRNLGLGVSELYTSAIGSYDYLKDIIRDNNYPGGDYLAARQITLSTSVFLKKKEQNLILNIVKSVISKNL